MAMIPGTVEWEARQGRMDALDRWRYVLAAVRARLRVMVGSERVSGLDRVDLERVARPDSGLAQAAERTAAALCSPALLQHSYRTYVWGSLLGQLDGRRWDAELLFVASMLHDLGLSAKGHGACPGAQCFSLDGVHAGASVLAQAPPERAEQIRRAVLLHLNVTVPGERHGWEAHYLRAGAVLDVIGQRHRQLPAEVVSTTLERHPRLGLKQELADWVRRESRLRPHSRMALLGRLGLVGMIRAAPFAD